MTYAQRSADISHYPVSLIVLTLDKCSLTYGASPCTATGGAGSECYNTYHTCQDRINYSKTTVDLKFTSFDTPLSLTTLAGEPYVSDGYVSDGYVEESSGDIIAKPYLQKVKPLPTRIGTKITAKGRQKITMVDELSNDIGIDPYVLNRGSIQGEYWKKLVARNPNYKGRPVKIYEGYLGLLESQFEQRWGGTIDNITIKNGIVTLDCIDTLSAIDGIPVPAKIESEIINTITAVQTTIILSSITKDDGTQIDTSGIIRIEDELISYTGINIPAKQLTGCTRGIHNTIGATHDAEERIGIVKYYAPDNPFDILQSILTDSGVPLADIDTTAFAYWKDWPKTDVDFSAIITEEDDITASELFWEIVNIIDCHVWQDENQKITIRRDISNAPGRTYATLTDESNIIFKSGSADSNEKSRRTRYVMYWGKSTLGGYDVQASYSDISIAVDADAEGENSYNDLKEEIIFNRWVSKSFLQEEIAERYCSNIVRRKLLNRIDARPIVKVSVEVKDEGNKTGDDIILETDEMLQPDGNPITERFLVIKREKRESKILYELLRMPTRRVAIIAPVGIIDYASATTDQKEYGFISNSQGEMPNGETGYHIW